MAESKKGTKKLGIMFGDNDFYYMCSAFLRVLLPDETFTHHKGHDLTFTKAQIVELFNGMAPSLYLLKQNCWRYASDHIPNYVKISESAVYLDDEVDKFIEENKGDCNGEFFAVNFLTAQISAI